MTQATKFATLAGWVTNLRQRGSQVLVLCHFQSTFLQAQEALERAGIDCEVLARRVTEYDLPDVLARSPVGVHLTLAQMLELTSQPDSRADGDRHPPLALIMIEKHPLPDRDAEILEFARNLSAEVAAGYLVSFEDAVPRYYLGERFIHLMQQLGMGDNDLVSSAMTARSIRRSMRKRSLAVTREVPAFSPAEWLAVNYSSTVPPKE